MSVINLLPLLTNMLEIKCLCPVCVWKEVSDGIASLYIKVRQSINPALDVISNNINQLTCT